MCDLHPKVPRHITPSNDNYKTVANLHNRSHEFAVRDKVMLQVRLKRCPPGTREKFHARHTGHHRVLIRICSNAIELEIPWEPVINPVFNVENLTPYRASINYLAAIPDLLSPTAVGPQHFHDLLQSLPPQRRFATKIEDIMPDRLMLTTDEGYQLYLVR